MWTFAQILNDFHKDKIKPSGIFIVFELKNFPIARPKTGSLEGYGLQPVQQPRTINLGFTGCGNTPALCQGTTSVVP
jgi:hypothetical protein